MAGTSKAQIRILVVTAGLAVLAGCATPAPPPPPPPSPPPPPVVIPPRPTPPSGATANMVIPPVGIDGIRRTVNYGLGTDQTTWNFRSALNVAALNCLDPRYANILPAYSSLLERHRTKLRRTNDALMASYRTEHGRSSYRNAYDGYMTRVYNYFALPPVQGRFCDVALQVANESLPVDSAGLDLFASTSLQRMEAVFHDFFSSYEQYRTNLAAWDARYGPPTSSFGATAPSTATFPLPTSGPIVQPTTGQPQVVAPIEGTSTPATPPPATGDQPIVFVSEPVTQGDSPPVEPEGTPGPDDQGGQG